jgi:hypothetical protein
LSSETSSEELWDVAVPVSFAELSAGASIIFEEEEDDVGWKQVDEVEERGRGKLVRNVSQMSVHYLFVSLSLPCSVCYSQTSKPLKLWEALINWHSTCIDVVMASIEFASDCAMRFSSMSSSFNEKLMLKFSKYREFQTNISQHLQRWSQWLTLSSIWKIHLNLDWWSWAKMALTKDKEYMVQDCLSKISELNLSHIDLRL